MKANQDKCHFLSSLDLSRTFSLPTCILENLSSQKPFGVTIDRKLNFNEHVTKLCNFLIYNPNTKMTFNLYLSYVSIWLLSFILDEPHQSTQ